jgi:sporulation protein YlmC with PRC-barrel domain
LCFCGDASILSIESPQVEDVDEGLNLVGKVMIYEHVASTLRRCVDLLISDIKDKIVYSKEMVVLGKAKDLEFDPTEMKVTNLVVEFEKEAAKELLGKLIVIRHAGGRVPVELVESIKDAIVLKQPKNDLKGSIQSL